MKAAYNDGRYKLAQDEETDQLPAGLAARLLSTRPPLAELVDAGAPSLKWLRRDLADLGKRIGADFEGDANKGTILAAIHARQTALAQNDQASPADMDGEANHAG
jgi:hypothetical protein